jgi:hypothetical protein
VQRAGGISRQQSEGNFFGGIFAVFNPVAEIKGALRVGASYVPGRVAHGLFPLDNAEIYARTGMEPLVWTGGLMSRASDYCNMVRELQRRGLPVVAASTGNGMRSMADNAASFERAVARVLDETGATHAAAGGQSKGPQDIMTALATSDVGASLRNQYYLVSPHKGGLLPATDAIVATSNLTRKGWELLPGGVKDAMRAWVELSPGSPELRLAKQGLGQFMARQPDAQVHNYTSDITPEILRGIGHDTLVPVSSQRLADELPGVVEHTLTSGPRHHVTAHMNEQFLDSVVELQRQARNQRMNLPADTPVFLPDGVSVPGARFQLTG